MICDCETIFSISSSCDNVEMRLDFGNDWIDVIEEEIYPLLDLASSAQSPSFFSPRAEAFLLSNGRFLFQIC
jgi:hypothetical protein